MMRVHLLSDLHNEFDPFIPSAVDADVVILAGDINVKARGVRWAMQAFPCPVLYVPGNHEYYSGHLFGTLAKMRGSCAASHVQVKAMLRVIEETVPVQRIWIDTAENKDTPCTGFEKAPSSEVSEILMVMYRGMVERKGYSAASAKEQLRATEPFHAFPYLVDALPDNL